MTPDNNGIPCLVQIDRHSLDLETGYWSMEIRFPAHLPVAKSDWARDLVRAITRSMIPGTESLGLTERKREELEAALAEHAAEEEASR